MILVDVNLLLYAKFSDLPQHERSREWLDTQLNANHKVGLPSPSILGFARLSTHAAVFGRPLTSDEAREQIGQWLGLSNVWCPAPTERHWQIFSDLVEATKATGALLPDAHLAALAIEHGLTLCSSDGDFARFEGLSWKNPLA